MEGSQLEVKLLVIAPTEKLHEIPPCWKGTMNQKFSNPLCFRRLFYFLGGVIITV